VRYIHSPTKLSWLTVKRLINKISENPKRARSGELAPIKSPRKRKEESGHKESTRCRVEMRPMTPQEQINVMLRIEKEEASVIGEPSDVDLEVKRLLAHLIETMRYVMKKHL